MAKKAELNTSAPAPVAEQKVEATKSKLAVAYDHFKATGESGKSNVNELLKVIVERLES